MTVRNLLGCGRFDDEVLLPIIRQAEECVKYAFQMGAKVALGSDAGAYRVMHGQGILDEEKAFYDILGKNEKVREWLVAGEKQIRERFRR